jgi:hypothetical protein
MMEITYVLLAASIVICVFIVVFGVWLVKKRWSRFLASFCGGVAGGIIGYFWPWQSIFFLRFKGKAVDFTLDLTFEDVYSIIGCAAGLLLGLAITRLLTKNSRNA